MIHVVFQQADVLALQKSFGLDASMKGEVMEIKDDFAVGPISDIYNPESVESRRLWWRQILAGGDYDGIADDGRIDDQKTVKELIERLQNDVSEIVWILSLIHI